MSLLGVRTKNNPRDIKQRGCVDDDTDDRETPASIYGPLHAEFGFTLDVAAAAHNAKCERYFDRASNGLAQSWAGECVWCNPPYSALRSWTEKAFAEVAKGCLRVVMLLPANRSEQIFWQDLIEPSRDRPGSGVITRNLRGRPRFERNGAPIQDAKKTTMVPPFGCVLVIIEPAMQVSSTAISSPETRTKRPDQVAK